jgi:molybdopterin-guanine dinucleotide biosynthesis protein A
MNTYIKQCTGVILAGGENRRMPVRKAFIEVNGQKIIDRNLRVLKRLFEEILIVTNEPEHYAYSGVQLLGDVYDIRGPMTGLLTALFNANNKWVFVLACDMPFISESLIRYMASKRNRYDAVVPSLKGRPEPLFAFYSNQLLPFMEESLLAGEKGLKYFLHNHKKRVQYIPLKELTGTGHGADSFINLNTPGDIDLYLKRNDIDKFKKAAERRGTCSV